MMRKTLLACATMVGLIGIMACDDLVDPITGDPVALSYAPCLGSVDVPSWFAYQDGTGAWTNVTATASGAFNFSVASGKGGVAIYTEDTGLLIVYATTDELKANLSQCNGGGVRDVSGQVTGYASNENVTLSMGGSSTNVFGNVPAPASFTVGSVDADVRDLTGVRYRTSGGTGGVAFEAFPTNVFLRRDVAGTTTSLVDFSSPTEAGAPLQRTLNVTNLAANEELKVYSYLALATTTANLARFEATAALLSGSSTAPFYGVAASRLNAGDVHMLQVNAEKSLSATIETRFKTVLFTDPTDQSMTLGAALGSVSVLGSAQPSATYTIQAGYDNFFEAFFTQGNGAAFRQVDVVMTKGYAGAVTSVTVAVPNMTGTTGFLSAWYLAAGVPSTWYFLATDANLSILNGKPIAYQGAERVGSFTP